MAMFTKTSSIASLVERLSILQKDSLKDCNEVVNDNRLPLSWDSEPKLTQAISTLSEAAQAVSDCSTKLVLALKAHDISTDGAQSICNEFGHLNEVVITAFALLASNGPGFPLWHEAAHTVHKLISTGLNLVESLNRDKLVDKELTTYTGMVWEAAKKVQQLPKSNRVAFRRSLMSKSAIVKETISEFTLIVEAGVSTEKGAEATSSSNQEEEGGEGGGGGDDFFDDLNEFDDDDDQYSEAELPVASCCLSCLEYVRPTLKTAMDAFDIEALDRKQKIADNNDSTEVVESLNLIRIHELWKLCFKIVNCTTDVGACLYPPLDVNQIKDSVMEIEKVSLDIGTLMNAIADNVATSTTDSTSSDMNTRLIPLRKVLPLWVNAIKKLNSAMEKSDLE